MRWGKALWLIGGGCLAPFIAPPSAGDIDAHVLPVIENVTLQPHTILHVTLVPDLGTRFLFPFILDDAKGLVPFTLNMTNPVFNHHRAPKRNFFTVEIDPQSDNPTRKAYVGNLFVTVGGYNISIFLSSTHDLRKHVTDYIFHLNEEQTEKLIEEKIEQRAKVFAQQYREKERRLAHTARQLALKKMMQTVRYKPRIRRIREEHQLANRPIRMEWDNVTSYGQRFHLIRYTIDNDSAQEIILNNLVVSAMNKDDPVTFIHGAHQLPKSLPAGETMLTFFATDSPLILDDRYQITLDLQTSDGDLRITW